MDEDNALRAQPEVPKYYRSLLAISPKNVAYHNNSMANKT
jgi:hypothetical protein